MCGCVWLQRQEGSLRSKPKKRKSTLAFGPQGLDQQNKSCGSFPSLFSCQPCLPTRGLAPATGNLPRKQAHCARGSVIAVLDGSSQYGCWISGTASYAEPEFPLLRMDQQRPSGGPACFCLSHPTREELKLVCGREDTNDKLVLCRGVCVYVCVCVTHAHPCMPVTNGGLSQP